MVFFFFLPHLSSSFARLTLTRLTPLPEFSIFRRSMSDNSIIEVFENIDGFITGPLEGFFPKYFGHAATDDTFQKTVKDLAARYPLGDATTSAKRFCHWLSALATTDCTGARGSWRTSLHAEKRPETELGAHVALVLSNGGTFQEPNEATVHVIGEFCPGQGISYKDGLLNLCAKASATFAAQPTRLFLHGFYLRGNFAELCVFDRCGLFTCDVFNIHENFQRFVTVILKYSLMTNAELGISDIILHDNLGPYISLKEDACIASLHRTLRLGRALATPEDMVSKATICFKARLPDSDRWDYVVKFKWRLKDDIAEEQVIQHAKNRNVWGSLSIEYFDEIIDTADLRSRLRHRPNRCFTSRDGPDVDGVPCGRGLDSYTVQTNNTFRVRTMVCIVTSPCGRPLHTHQSVLELLCVLRDAVKAHRSLFEDGGILHQDIAPGNIIITDFIDPEAPKGILIDLDVAMVLDVGPRNPGGISITGTPPFMAIGALKGRPRTYRHDLESFLYVFLWAVISDGSEFPPKGSQLQGWRSGSYEEMAERKMVDMAPHGFQAILSEFSPKFQALQRFAEGFRQLLFPVREDDGTLWTGTIGSQDGRAMLYNEILQLFDQAISL